MQQSSEGHETAELLVRRSVRKNEGQPASGASRNRRRKGVKRKLKLILLALASAIVTLAAMEVGLNIVSRLRWGREHRKLKIDERRSYAMPENVGFEDPNRTWENQLDLHPLFGYVMNPELPGINNYGFACSHDFILTDGGYRLKPDLGSDSLIIGVFGGSFAALTAHSGKQYFLERLRKLYPDREPVLVNLAVGGHAIPQSAFIFLYFRSMVDVAVFIDGVNEPYNYVLNNLADSPPEYAKASHYLYRTSINELNPERFKLTHRIFRSRSRLKAVTEGSLRPGLRGLMLTYYVWRAVKNRCERNVVDAMSGIERSYLRYDTKFHDFDNGRMFRIAAEQWARYHLLVHDTCSSSGVVDVHALQPSPYLPGSKKSFTPEEERILKADTAHLQSSVETAYPRMRKSLAKLGRGGAVTVDLSYVFAEESGEVWVDPYHANVQGYHKVIDRICDALASAKAGRAEAQLSASHSER